MRARIGLVLCGCVWAAGAAWGQGGRIPDTRPTFETLIERLGSPVYAAREQAVAELVSRRDLSLDMAEGWLARTDLGPEQRLRVERVAREVFARGPRAALGIQFSPGRTETVRVARVVAGFPASDLLRDGDEFLEIDEIPMSTQAACRAAILSKRPGESIMIRLRRGGDVVEVRAPLGSFSSFDNAMGPSETDMLAAWTLRRSRARDVVVGEVLTPEPGPGVEGVTSPEAGSRPWEVAFTTSDTPGGVRVGGQSPEAEDLSVRQLAAMDRARSLTLEDLEGVGEADLAVQIGLLRDRRGLLLDDVEQVSRLLEGGNLDRGQMMMMRERIDVLQDQLETVERQIRTLDEARRERP